MEFSQILKTVGYDEKFSNLENGVVGIMTVVNTNYLHYHSLMIVILVCIIILI